LPGTVAGGLLIGLAQGITAIKYPAASQAVWYLLMAVVLLLRPRGLFGEEGMMT
jgi:branched-chain amino acid transport system permease protein